MADGNACSIANCGYITTTNVADETEMQYKLQLLQLQIQVLKIHTTGVHNAGGGQVRTTGNKAKMDTPKIKLGVDQQA